MNASEPPSDDRPARSYLPRLSGLEWLVFGVLAVLFAFANIYATLLTGIGFGGSIMAVLASALVLGLVRGRVPALHRLNLGQTIASAGASMGTAVAGYAAVLLAVPDFDPGLPALMALFASLGVLGALVGAAARRYMVRYFFPSGTACAVIQKSVAGPGAGDTPADNADEARRSVRILTVWGSLAALVSVPTKIGLERGGEALIGLVSIGDDIELSLDPFLYGVGMIVGPRVGLGLLAGSLAVPWLLRPGMVSLGADPGTALMEWTSWVAIALVTAPTLAGIGFTYLLRTPPSTPPGFSPGRVTHPAPPGRSRLYALLTGAAVVASALSAHAVFDLPLWVAVLVMALTWPLCIVNGRITADTDVNPLLLLAIAVLALCAFTVAGAIVPLLGMVVIGVTISGMAIDMMQDHRTGFLLDANPNHQSAIQVIGVALAAACAVPFFLLLDATMGIGADGGLPAPGPLLYLTAARGFAGAFPTEGALAQVILVVSAAGTGYAFLAAWSPTARWMPSLFGVAIGLLLPLPLTLAIAIGSVLTPAVGLIHQRGRRGQERRERREESRRTLTLVGASVLGAGAVTSALLAMLSALFQILGLDWFFPA